MNKRRVYDETLIERMCYVRVGSNYPIEVGSPEFKAKMKEESLVKQVIFDLTVLDLRDKLIERYNGRKSFWECAKEAEDLLLAMPEELMTNVQEWIDDKPLSDVKIHGISMNDVMTKFSFKSKFNASFPYILSIFGKWKNANYNKNFFERYFFVDTVK